MRGADANPHHVGRSETPLKTNFKSGRPVHLYQNNFKQSKIKFMSSALTQRQGPFLHHTIVNISGLQVVWLHILKNTAMQVSDWLSLFPTELKAWQFYHWWMENLWPRLSTSAGRPSIRPPIFAALAFQQATNRRAGGRELRSRPNNQSYRIF